MPEAKHEKDQPRKTFEELARDLECDENEAAFEEKVRKIADSSVQQPPQEPISD